MNKPSQVQPGDDQSRKLKRKVYAEAALWMAKLHGPDRSRAMELACLKWQAESADNRLAFERCTDVWLEVPGAVRASKALQERLGSQDDDGDEYLPRAPKRKLLMLAVVLLGIGGIGGATLQHLRGDDDYRTEVGEAQTVLLDDGTRMTLNTDTHVRVDYGAAQRTVDVKGGEAVFEVAKDAKRPFVVRAAASEVVAVGTVFAVRFTAPGPSRAEALAVTLIEGQVSLRPAAKADAGEVAPSQAVLMRPGDRVRLARAAGQAARTTQQVDRPRLEQVMAWKRSEAVFENTSLVDAVAEMNRYSRTPVVLVGDVAQATWQVSGQYRTGDNVGFANALAGLHGLVVQEREGRLELSRRR